MNKDREKPELIRALERLRDEVLLDDEYRAWREGLRYECLERMYPSSREDYPQFREDLRLRCLSDLTGLRRKRQVTRFAVSAAVMAAALLLVLLYPKVTPPFRRLPRELDLSYHAVRTRPLTDRHRPFATRMNTVHTRTHDSGAERVTARIFRTPSKTEIPELTDSELLAMFHPRPCAIIREGSDRTRLYFLHAEDRRLFSKKTFRIPPE